MFKLKFCEMILEMISELDVSESSHYVSELNGRPSSQMRVSVYVHTVYSGYETVEK